MAQTAIASLRKILNAFRALNSKGIDPMNGTQTDLLGRILKEVQALSLGGSVADGSITAIKLASDSVTTIKILDANVTTPKIADANVTPTKLSQPFTRSSAVATGSGTAVDYTAIPSWVRIITVAFNGFSTNGASIPQIQIGSGSIDTTASYANDAILNSSTGTVATSTSGFILSGANAATYSYKGSVVLHNVDSNIWTISGVLGTGSGQVANCGGVKSLSGVLDRLRVTTQNGTDTFDAGSINVFWQ